jgi:hypothetical protein
MYFESCKISAKVQFIVGKLGFPLGGGAEQETISSRPSLDSASMRSHLKRECERNADRRDKSQWNYANAY